MPTAMPPVLNRVTADSAPLADVRRQPLDRRAEPARDRELRRVEEQHVVVAPDDAGVAQRQRPRRRREDGE